MRLLWLGDLSSEGTIFGISTFLGPGGGISFFRISDCLLKVVSFFIDFFKVIGLVTVYLIYYWPADPLVPEDNALVVVGIRLPYLLS